MEVVRPNPSIIPTNKPQYGSNPPILSSRALSIQTPEQAGCRRPLWDSELGKVIFPKPHFLKKNIF